MDYISLNLVNFNARGLRDRSKCARLLGELLNFCVNVAAVQETHFTCAEDCQVLRDDFGVFSAFGSRCSAEVSLLVGCSLNAIVNLVFAGDGVRLVVADVAVKSFEFRVVAVYAPNSYGERLTFLQRLELFLDDLKRIILAGDRNTIDKAGRGASGSDRFESSLIDLMAQHDLVDRFRVDHLGKEMWAWLNRSLSVRIRTYLDKVLGELTPNSLDVPRSTE